VLDLEGVEIGPALTELHGKVVPDDPYIEKLRVGRNRPGVVRVVLDLKSEVSAQAFALKPVAGYEHRLVLDLQRRDLLLEVRRMAEEVNCVPHTDHLREGEHRHAKMVVVVGHLTNANASHDDNLLSRRLQRFERLR